MYIVSIILRKKAEPVVHIVSFLHLYVWAQRSTPFLTIFVPINAPL